MKKVVSISVVIALLMLSLLALSSGTVRAGDSVASPHLQAKATATPASRTIPVTGGGPGTIPVTGGAPDPSGSILLVGAGALLVAGGLVLYGRRRTRV